MTHFTIVDYGTVWLVWPLSIQATDWLHETAPEFALFFHDALAVEPRYIVGVLQAITEAGFGVQSVIARRNVIGPLRSRLDTNGWEELIP